MADRRPIFNILPVGWDFPGWVDEFYPADLPQEWRLAYFANEFPGVLIPQQIWLNLDLLTLSDWCNDVGEGFRFYLQLNQEVIEPTLTDKKSGLGNHFGGFAIDSSWLDHSLHPDRFRYQGVDCFTLFYKGFTVQDIERLSLNKTRIACLLAAADLADLKSQRRVLEQLAEQVTARAEVLLFLNGDPPALQKLRELRTLSQLLGLS